MDILCKKSQYAEVARQVPDGVGGERKVVLRWNTGGGKTREYGEEGEEGLENYALD